jgi:hypothetical protein
MKIQVGDLVRSIYKKSGRAPGGITHEYDEGRSLGIVVDVQELTKEEKRRVDFTYRYWVEWLSVEKKVEVFADHFLEKIQ